MGTGALWLVWSGTRLVRRTILCFRWVRYLYAGRNVVKLLFAAPVITVAETAGDWIVFFACSGRRFHFLLLQDWYYSILCYR